MKPESPLTFSRIVISLIHNILAEQPKSERIARLIYNEVGGDHEKAIQFLRSLHLDDLKEVAIHNALADIRLGLHYTKSEKRTW